MAQYISTLLHDAAGDFSRSTKFIFFVNKAAVSKLSKSLDFIKDAQIDIITKDVQIPSITTSELEINITGHKINFPGRVNFEKPLTCTFYLDEKHKIYQLFKNWVALADENFMVADSSTKSYKATRNITTELLLNAVNYDEDTPLVEYKFLDAYPTSISAPQYATDGLGQIQEITVTFDYSTYEVTDLDNTDWSDIGATLLNSATEFVGDLISSPLKVFNGEGVSDSPNIGGNRDFFG